MPTVVSGLASQWQATPTIATVNEFIHALEFPFTPEQERAFRLIAEHSVSKHVENLRMYIGGPGGTGKSYVIASLDRFFSSTGQQRRFRLCSYTGVAANNIAGMTLHSALCLGSVPLAKINAVTSQDLIAMWDGVDYLFIDEVSMIGCAFLYRVSQAL
ncbi:hypothetical protein EV360DRAFT_37662, partial [Lentinula raphanica]